MIEESSDFVKNENGEEQQARLIESLGTYDYVARSPEPRKVAAGPGSMCCADGKIEPRPIFERCYSPRSQPIDPAHKWAVFHPDYFAEEGFTTEEEAENWLCSNPTLPLWK